MVKHRNVGAHGLREGSGGEGESTVVALVSITMGTRIHHLFGDDSLEDG